MELFDGMRTHSRSFLRQWGATGWIRALSEEPGYTATIGQKIIILNFGDLSYDTFFEKIRTHEPSSIARDSSKTVACGERGKA
jgi:hypothetical protein